ncbi:MAG: deoxyribose-phosphate aldolase [Proteobacteria bacterium]|nr:deoxyribose-phosphate aldolase [Pseudomonadota bacterium]
MLSMLDVTYLEDKTDNAALESLCQAIQKAPMAPAAIFVYLRDLAFVKSLLANYSIAFGVPVNFPQANKTKEQVIEELNLAKQLGADEIDVVIPYKDFLQRKDFTQIAQFVGFCRKALPTQTLKVILETGEIKQAQDIYALSIICCEQGADFIKTSTGKVAMGATLDATKSIIGAIKDYHRQSGRQVGLKVSGGVRTVAQAQSYIDQVKELLGEAWLTKEHFRIGASALFKALC